MRRSSRSTTTGIGSRGGHGHLWAHDPEYRRAYCRRWRAEHPEYRERERARMSGFRRAVALDRDRREVDELVARLGNPSSASQRSELAA